MISTRMTVPKPLSPEESLIDAQPLLAEMAHGFHRFGELHRPSGVSVGAQIVTIGNATLCLGADLQPNRDSGGTRIRILPLPPPGSWLGGNSGQAVRESAVKRERAFERLRWDGSR